MPPAEAEVLAIRQLRLKGLGRLERTFRSMGYRIRYLDAPEDDLAAVDAEAPALLVVLGGPPSATDQERFPFLQTELQLVQRRIASGRPLLGICLGAQVIARALGGGIRPGAVSELGWGAIQLTAAGQNAPLRYLAQTPVLHWHADNIVLPPGAERLAYTDLCPVQAFRHGAQILGLQFHPEVDAVEMEQWLVAHLRQIDAEPRLDVDDLRAETQECGDWLAQRTDAMLRDWLGEMIQQEPIPAEPEQEAASFARNRND